MFKENSLLDHLSNTENIWERVEISRKKIFEDMLDFSQILHQTSSNCELVSSLVRECSKSAALILVSVSSAAVTVC